MEDCNPTPRTISPRASPLSRSDARSRHPRTRVPHGVPGRRSSRAVQLRRRRDRSGAGRPVARSGTGGRRRRRPDKRVVQARHARIARRLAEGSLPRAGRTGARRERSPPEIRRRRAPDLAGLSPADQPSPRSLHLPDRFDRRHRLSVPARGRSPELRGEARHLAETAPVLHRRAHARSGLRTRDVQPGVGRRWAGRCALAEGRAAGGRGIRSRRSGVVATRGRTGQSQDAESAGQERRRRRVHEVRSRDAQGLRPHGARRRRSGALRQRGDVHVAESASRRLPDVRRHDADRREPRPRRQRGPLDDLGARVHDARRRDARNGSRVRASAHHRPARHHDPRLRSLEPRVQPRRAAVQVSR